MTQTVTKSNTTPLEGEIVKPSKSSTVLMRELPLKRRKFVKYYKEGETMGNGTKSAIKAGYSPISAAQQASVLLRNPKVLSILNDSVEEAEEVIRALVRDDKIKPDTRLAAAREILDRTIGKPIQRSESVHVNITVESMLDNNSPD